MASKRHVPPKRMWLAWGIVALATATAAAGASQDPSPTQTQAELSYDPSMTISFTILGASPSGSHSSHKIQGSPSEADSANEAARAYKQALVTLASLTALPSSRAFEPHHQFSWPTGNSILSSILPNPQGHGPLGSAIRIAIRLRHQSWLPRFLSSRLSQDGGRRRSDEELSRRAIKVLDLLQHAADLGHLDALFALGKISLLPPTPHFTADPILAYKTFETHAALTGNATSQGYLAFFHATGFLNVVPVDQAKAQLYYTFAANGGDKAAQMALGYRYWTGIGVVENCEHAVEWYSAAAEKVMARFLSGPPGGRTLPLTPTCLSDLAGGVYGPGSSVASTGIFGQRPAIKAARARAAGETWEDILEYYIFNADRGETDFAFRLGKIFYHGSIYNAPGGIASGGEGVGRLPRDFERARFYFESITRLVWTADPGDIQGKRDDNTPVGLAAHAAGYLGRMYLRGEGVRIDLKLAKMWFERGAFYGEKESHNGLGIIWRDGLIEGRKDIKRALSHFAAAAGQDLAEAQINLGKYYERDDPKLAISYFDAAMRHGSPLEAFYYLAKIQEAKMKSMPAYLKPGACSIATAFFKVVAERGSWDEDLIREGEEAWETETPSGKQLAMLKWWMSAERGFEIGQNNLAFLLDQDKSLLRRTSFANFFPSNNTARLALTQWMRSAAQNNIDALVKVGDYYYHGLGVPDEPDNVRWEKAAGYYRSAADTQFSALAMWNLGWMYEHGYGVLQDFHLAKRHYDFALETNPEGYLPVTLSLFRLHARSLWHTLMGGEGGLSLWSRSEVDLDPDQTARRRELDEGPAVTGESASETDEDVPVEDDGPWYMGKAREEFNRRMRDTALPGDDEDPVQWARDRRNAELDRDSDLGPEDMFEAALRGGHRGEEEGDEFVETMVLVVLCLIVSLLLYIRGRWVERLRREEQQQRQQVEQREERDGGLFPPPGDPARDDWAVAR
ncbi:hypothetical protein BC826DRAFT_1012129 [Russula brevipes]|nr:hypothetical protein BC826DRAFT_1012129 [Russula brevipes]